MFTDDYLPTVISGKLLEDRILGFAEYGIEYIGGNNAWAIKFDIDKVFKFKIEIVNSKQASKVYTNKFNIKK
jgi:hypothetical protein